MVIRAIYEDGVFRPTGEVDLPEHCEVEINPRVLSALPSAEVRHKSVWELADEIFGDLPESEKAKSPTDGASQHDHYIYGLPKRAE